MILKKKNSAKFHIQFHFHLVFIRWISSSSVGLHPEIITILHNSL